MRRLKVKVVPGPVQIRRHGRNERCPVLAPKGLNVYDASDLGNCVGLVSRLKRSRQQVLLPQGLRGETRVNARRSEKEQAPNPEAGCGVQHVDLDANVFREEVCWVRRVRE